MADNFNEPLNNEASVEESKRDAYNAKVRETRQKNFAAWKAAFQQTLEETSGEIKEQLSTRSNDIEVVKCLTFGEPTYITRKSNPGVKEPVPNVVGYIVKNISSTPIPAYTTKCELVDGAYVKKPAQTTIAPGASVPFRKLDFVNLLAAPEFSFTASNGKLTTGHFEGSTQAELEAFLEKHSFRPSDAKVGDMIQSISTVVDGKNVVLPDFKDVFAYLENKVEKKGRVKGEKADKQTPQELAANYVRRLIAGAQNLQ